MSSLRWPLVAALCTAAIGCNSPDSTGPSPLISTTFAIAPASQWSGGSVTVVSPAFSLFADSSFSVFVEDAAVGHRRLSDSAIVLTLPSLPSGRATIRVASGPDTVVAGSVAVAGFAGVTATDAVVGNLYSMLDPVAGSALGTVVLPSGASALASVDLLSGRVSVFLGPAGAFSYYGPAPDFRKGEVTFQKLGAPSGAVTWRIGPSGADSIGAAPYWYGRFAAQIGDSAWLLTDNHWGYAMGPGGQQSPTISLESTWGFVYSPQRDLVTPLMNASGGAPIFDGATGTIPLTVPSMKRVTAAAFSPDERTVFLGGAPTSGGRWLLESVDLASGDPVAFDTTFAADTAGPIGMAMDPAGGQLVVAVNAGAAGRVQLRVYDASTLALLATLDPPADAPACGGCWIAPTVVDMPTRRAYVLIGGDSFSDRHPRIYSFDMLPPPGAGTTAPAGRR